MHGDDQTGDDHGGPADRERDEFDALVLQLRRPDTPSWPRRPPAPPRTRTEPVGPSRAVRRLLAVVAVLAATWTGCGALGGGSGGIDQDAVLGGVPDRPTDYGDDGFAFMGVQPTDPTQPVGYNPCLRLPVEINYAGATPDILELVQTTIAQVNRASGLKLFYAGANQRYRRTQGVTGRILVSFNDLPHDGALAEAAGVGGSMAYTETPPGVTRFYVGGSVTLNTAEFNHYSRHDQALVLAHEFGHAVGLAHVGDAGQIMGPNNYTATRWGEGDLTGLARLGRLPCQ